MLRTSFRIILALLAALTAMRPAVAASPAGYTNPVLYADYSDPDVIQVGGNFYMVASTFHFSPGIPVLQSPDLVHWKIMGHVLPRLPFAAEYDMIPPFTLTDATLRPVGPGLRYAGGVWAPAIRFHDGLFYVYWPTPDEGIFMSTARDPAGPWTPPVAVIGEPKLEDPCPFWDDDGSAWLVHSRVGAGPLILHRMSKDGRRVLDAGTVIAQDPVKLPVLEGPKLYKRRGWYYIFAPIGGVEGGEQAVGRARRIAGPYEWRIVLAQGGTQIHGPHQGGYVETPAGEGWFLHFNSTGAFGRIDYLEPVHWHDDWPLIGEPVNGETFGQPVAGAPLPVSVPTTRWPRLQDADEFTAPVLGAQWEWNHNPLDEAWSLTARPGWLRLRALPAADLVTARNTLTQVLQGPSMTATARLDVAALSEAQRAGLAMFGTRPAWIGAVREDGATHVVFANAGEESAVAPVAGTIVQLRVQVGADQQARFAYSLDDGAHFTEAGVPVMLRFSWWKGARPALFTYVRSPPATAAGSGHVDIDWFHVDTGTP
ncbi:MAG TPA: glycoside hydrolase 43 family protein [Steroidobacteraceae bacterium]|nr:glycoside hydrolase 43 family protein [Steroidobacteraceae bacterium]